MTSTYCRVTVVSGNRHVDLALPSVLPISDVLPQLLRYCTPDDRADHPAAWTLAKVGGSDIDLEHSLDDAGVLDGDVLELRSAETAPRQAYVEDVRDAIEDVVDESGGVWDTRTTRSFVLSVASIGLALAALPSFARRPEDVRVIAGGLVVAALATAVAGWSKDRAHAVATQLMLATGCLWGGISGWLFATRSGWPGVVPLATGLVLALLIAAGGRAITTLATPHLAALGITTGAATLAGVAVSVWEPLTPERVAGVMAVLVVGVLPRASVSVGGLATADYRVRKSVRITQQELADRVRLSSALLLGGVIGAAAVGAAAGVVLCAAESLWDRLLAVTIGVALLLRSRVFSQILHLLPLRIAGCVVLAATGIRIGALPEVQPWFLLAAAAVAAGLVALSALPLSDITRARVKRVLNWSESVVVIAMIALGAAAIGLYDMVADTMK